MPCSCGGDIRCAMDTRSVPFVCTFISMYVYSRFVIALAASFIIRISCNFTQILGMTILRINSRFSLIGLWSRSKWLFLEKKNWYCIAFIYGPISVLLFTYYYMYVNYDNILDKLKFKGLRPTSRSQWLF